MLVSESVSLRSVRLICSLCDAITFKMSKISKKIKISKISKISRMSRMSRISRIKKYQFFLSKICYHYGHDGNYHDGHDGHDGNYDYNFCVSFLFYNGFSWYCLNTNTLNKHQWGKKLRKLTKKHKKDGSITSMMFLFGCKYNIKAAMWVCSDSRDFWQKSFPRQSEEICVFVLKQGFSSINLFICCSSSNTTLRCWTHKALRVV